MDTPLFEAQIPDWRAMVDVVLVDTAYDGEVFNITLSDVPEKKNDLVSGHYELAADIALVQFFVGTAGRAEEVTPDHFFQFGAELHWRKCLGFE